MRSSSRKDSWRLGDAVFNSARAQEMFFASKRAYSNSPALGRHSSFAGIDDFQRTLVMDWNRGAQLRQEAGRRGIPHPRARRLPTRPVMQQW